MRTPEGFRKRVTHLDRPREVHELTFSCVGRRPLLAMTDAYGLFGASLGRAVDRHAFDLLAFVFMPEHVHLLVKPRSDDYSTAELLYAIKRPFSFHVKRLFAARRDPLEHQLVIRERPGKTSFRFWQEGPGFDRNMITAEGLVNSLRYIHRNPVKRGLCTSPEEWPWSSYMQYRHPDREPVAGLPRVRRMQV